MKIRDLALAIASLFAASLASAAQAEPIAATRLVRCEAGNCLLIRGHRASPASVVRVNDREVAVTGGRNWKIRMPVSTVENWSTPFARTIEVAVIDQGGAVEHRDAVRLPVGLLGHNPELALLVVRPR